VRTLLPSVRTVLPSVRTVLPSVRTVSLASAFQRHGEHTR
jgi:hypothetical protein